MGSVLGEVRSPRLSLKIFMSFAFEQDSWPIGLRPCSNSFRFAKKLALFLSQSAIISDSKAKDLRVQERDGVRGLFEPKTLPIASISTEKMHIALTLLPPEIQCRTQGNADQINSQGS